MEEKVKLTLSKLGLTDGEIKVYLSLAELDSVTVGPIIRKSGISAISRDQIQRGGRNRDAPRGGRGFRRKGSDPGPDRR